MFSSVQSLSRVQLFAPPRTAACQASLSISNSWSLLKLMFIESVMPSHHLILCHPLQSFPALGSFPKCCSHQWPKDWSFSFSISPSKEYSELTSFRFDWFDLLAVQGTLKSLLQRDSSKALILSHNITVIQVYAPTTNAKEAEVEQFYEGLEDLQEPRPKKRCPFHHRGLECKSRKSRDNLE